MVRYSDARLSHAATRSGLVLGILVHGEISIIVYPFGYSPAVGGERSPDIHASRCREEGNLKEPYLFVGVTPEGVDFLNNA